MILRFIQTLFVLGICLTTQAQTLTSFYVKPLADADVQKTYTELATRFPEAQVSQPFAHIRHGNLHHVLRIDGSSLTRDAVTQAVNAPVEYIEKVPVANLQYTPNDLGVELGSPNQWYLHMINAPAAWDYSKGSADVVIAVVDNAFLPEHPDLIDKVSLNLAEIPNDDIDNDGNGFKDDFAGWNAVDNNGNVYIQSASSPHGTHVAGIAAAETDNGTGMASLSFLTKWLPVKAGAGNDNITHGYEGIAYGATVGAKVINCSWGTFDSSATAKAVIDFALSENCFVVASAGNFATEQLVYPASYQGVISVASTTQTDAKLNTSSFGTRVNICAPGSGIWSTSHTSGSPSYAFMSGTSMASPLVAALLALMSGYAPPNSDADIIDCLYNTAQDIDGLPANSAYDSLLGHGRINAEQAMACLQAIYGLNVPSETLADGLGLYPNPSQGLFTLQTGSVLRWTVRDVHGKSLLSGTGTQGDASSLPSGLYFLTTELSSGKRSVIKFVKE